MRAYCVDAYSGCASWTTSSSFAGTSYIAQRSAIVSLNARERAVVIEIADVLADEGLPVDDQRDRVLQIGADRTASGRAVGNAATAAARSRARAAAPPDRRARRASTESSMRRAICALAGQETRRRCRPAARSASASRTRSVRSSGSRWSSRARPARPRQRADGAAACRAA